LGSIPELNGNKIGRTILKNCNLVIVWWPRGAWLLNVTNLIRSPYTFYDFFQKSSEKNLCKGHSAPPKKRVCILMKSRSSKKKTWLWLLCVVEWSKLGRFPCFIQVDNMFTFAIVYCTRRYGVYILCDFIRCKIHFEKYVIQNTQTTSRQKKSTSKP
jgi:hypothetical protein